MGFVDLREAFETAPDPVILSMVVKACEQWATQSIDISIKKPGEFKMNHHTTNRDIAKIAKRYGYGIQASSLQSGDPELQIDPGLMARFLETRRFRVKGDTSTWPWNRVSVGTHAMRGETECYCKNCKQTVAQVPPFKYCPVCNDMGLCSCGKPYTLGVYQPPRGQWESEHAFWASENPQPVKARVCRDCDYWPDYPEADPVKHLLRETGKKPHTVVYEGRVITDRIQSPGDEIRIGDLAWRDRRRASRNGQVILKTVPKHGVTGDYCAKKGWCACGAVVHEYEWIHRFGQLESWHNMGDRFTKLTESEIDEIPGLREKVIEFKAERPELFNQNLCAMPDTNLCGDKTSTDVDKCSGNVSEAIKPETASGGEVFKPGDRVSFNNGEKILTVKDVYDTMISSEEGFFALKECIHHVTKSAFVTSGGCDAG